MTRAVLTGRLVLADSVVPGRIDIDDGWIVSVEPDPGADGSDVLLAPGFVDVHVHGWGGHDAMGELADLDGMARALLRRGVTSFLPTAVTAPLDELERFAERVRGWRGAAPADGAEPLGFNLEGPFLAPARRGAHDPNRLLAGPPWRRSARRRRVGDRTVLAQKRMGPHAPHQSWSRFRLATTRWPACRSIFPPITPRSKPRPAADFADVRQRPASA